VTGLGGRLDLFHFYPAYNPATLVVSPTPAGGEDLGDGREHNEQQSDLEHPNLPICANQQE
jgi:hypothetical protein